MTSDHQNNLRIKDSQHWIFRWDLMACVEGPKAQRESWNSPLHTRRTEEDRILGLFVKN